MRDEIDIIESNINFHLGFGIQQFVVTDNGSADGTRDILADFQRRLGKSMVVIDDAEPAHRQAERVNRMIHIAKQRFRPRWIVSSDADEFWYPLSGRYDTELNGQKNILNCYWHNFLPRPNADWQEFTDIGEMPGYYQRFSKVFCYARGLIEMYEGNHESRSIPRIIARSDNIRVYHYPVRSYKQFERKVVQGHRGTLNAGRPDTVNWHWREYYQAWENGELPRKYEELASRNRIVQDSTMAELLRSGSETRPLTSAR